MSTDLYTSLRDEELVRLRAAMPDGRWSDAGALLDSLVLDDVFSEFLTIPAASYLDG
jgi:hypothetical protein